MQVFIRNTLVSTFIISLLMLLLLYIYPYLSIAGEILAMVILGVIVLVLSYRM